MYTASIVSRMLTLGVDQSAQNSGICILDDKGNIVALQRITPPSGLTDSERLQYIRDGLQAVVVKHPGISLGAMEGYSYGSINKKYVLGEIGGTVKLVLADNHIPLMEVAPKQLKKFATGHGSADKDQVQISIKAKWGEDITQNDESDAYVLARIAYTSLQQNSSHRSELEVLKKIASKPLRKSKGKRRLSGLSGSI